MDLTLHGQLEDAVWVARTLFSSGLATGSSANLSIVFEEELYITAAGSCFGRLTVSDFARLSLEGEHRGGPAPSKEYPLHLRFVNRKSGIRAVLHTHPPYCTRIACLPHQNHTDVIRPYTPYLRMKVGKIGLVKYAPPGSRALLDAFQSALPHSDGFLLAHHGAVIGSSGILECFYGLAELEESAKLQWYLSGVSAAIPILD